MNSRADVRECLDRSFGTSGSTFDPRGDVAASTGGVRTLRGFALAVTLAASSPMRLPAWVSHHTTRYGPSRKPGTLSSPDDGRASAALAAVAAV